MGADHFYPGNDYVDIVGVSLYDSDPGAQTSPAWTELLALGKPVAFTEYGPRLQHSPTHESPPYFSWDNLIQMQAFKTHFPEAVFFIRWHNVWATVNQNNAVELMNDPWLVDLEQLQQHRQLFCW